ncbi:unnamed protein product [Peniophora sp. CBMAI 1063]|nr:unnamed protein product [Peniophora sp. CBMAI 1063]
MPSDGNEYIHSTGALTTRPSLHHLVPGSPPRVARYAYTHLESTIPYFDRLGRHRDEYHTNPRLSPRHHLLPAPATVRASAQELYPPFEFRRRDTNSTLIAFSGAMSLAVGAAAFALASNAPMSRAVQSLLGQYDIVLCYLELSGPLLRRCDSDIRVLGLLLEFEGHSSGSILLPRVSVSGCTRRLCLRTGIYRIPQVELISRANIYDAIVDWSIYGFNRPLALK